MVDITRVGRTAGSVVNVLLPRQRPTILAIRPRDLVVLELSYVNLEVKPGENPELVRRSGGDHAFLIVEFPPQNLAERAYFQSSEGGKTLQIDPAKKPDQAGYVEEKDDPPEDPQDPPIQALLSDESRIVFLVPEGFRPIPYNIQGILAACGELEMSVPPNALPPRDRRMERLFMPASALMGEEVPVRGKTSMIDRLVAASRGRQRVRGHGPFVAESNDALASVIDPVHRIVPADSDVPTARSLSVGVSRSIEVMTDESRRLIDAVRAFRPTPKEPTDTQTAIESPFRLIVSPNRLGGWAHADSPVEVNARTELWHTRLGVRVVKGDSVEVNEDLEQNRTIRAVWARGRFDPDHTDPQPPIPAFDPSNTGMDEFRMSLDDFDRHNIVHLSSNFGISLDGRFYEPEAVEVTRLMLSSLGSWMNVRGAWNPEPKGLSVEEWIHRGTVGRDHYVRVVYRGYLVPFGHRASLIKITERRFHPERDGNPAYQRQRMFIVVKEPEKLYANPSLTFPGGKKQVLRGMPLRSVRITSLTTPDLDDPTKTGLQGQGRKAFWPKVAGSPFRFKFVAADLEGNVVEFSAPLVWVDKSVTDTGVSSSTTLLNKVLAGYEAGEGLTGVPSPNRVELHGQSVAYAPAGRPDDTTFQTDAVRFGSVGVGSTPSIHPVVRKAEMTIPALRQIAGSDQPSEVEYHDTYLINGFETPGQNDGEVVFKATTSIDVDFASQGDRSGGLVAPNLRISGISRLLGPVSGNPDVAATGQFDPKEFFAGLNAKIFGVIDLEDVIAKLPFANDVGKAPQFIGKALNQVEGFLEDLNRLRDLLAGVPALWNTVKNEVDAVTGEIQKMLGLTGTGTLTQKLTVLKAKVAGLSGSVASEASITEGMREQIQTRLTAIDDALADIAKLTGVVDQFVQGIELPRALKTRFEWRPQMGGWPSGAPPNDQIFRPNRPDPLVVLVEGAAANDGGKPQFTVTTALEDFDLQLIAPATFLVIKFDHVKLLMRAGRKPEVDVKMGEVLFDGVLSFVNTLKELIPLSGFEDPPAVAVDAEGITASFSLGLPNCSVGVFSLENLSLGAGFTVPFVGDPLSVWFKFCERENPALLSVSLFAGGFFFGVTTDPGGVRILEAAIEFGANLSMDFGVASGGVSAMAGMYFKLEMGDASLTGYFRVRGHVSALGIVTVSIELYLDMSYEFSSGKCVGRASLSIDIEVFMFSASVTISCEKKFAGSNGDPTFAQTMSPYPLDPANPAGPQIDPWEEYCVAFA